MLVSLRSNLLKSLAKHVLSIFKKNSAVNQLFCVTLLFLFCLISFFYVQNIRYFTKVICHMFSCIDFVSDKLVYEDSDFSEADEQLQWKRKYNEQGGKWHFINPS